MIDKPRRAWFQLHLSTAIVMMFVAGGLLWANTRSRELHTQEREIVIRVYGWPMQACYRFDRYYDESLPKKIYWGELALSPKYAETVSGIEMRLLVNVLVALFVLLLIAGVAEFLIRRREARAP